MAAKGHHHHAA